MILNIYQKVYFPRFIQVSDRPHRRVQQHVCVHELVRVRQPFHVRQHVRVRGPLNEVAPDGGEDGFVGKSETTTNLSESRRRLLEQEI